MEGEPSSPPFPAVKYMTFVGGDELYCPEASHICQKTRKKCFLTFKKNQTVKDAEMSQSNG